MTDEEDLENGDYYVYAYYEARPDSKNFKKAIYVGKGRGGRAQKHITNSSNPILARIIEQTKLLGLKSDFRILMRFENEKDAYTVEKYLIKKWKRIDCGGTLVNFTDGGEGGINPTKETRERMSTAHRGKTWTPEIREKLLIARQNISAETRKKLSEAGMGRKLSPEHIEKLKKANTGRTPSEDTRKKMSQAKKGKRLKIETIEKMIESRKGYKHSEKTIEKMKGRKHSEEAKEKMSQAKKGKTFSLETRAKMSEAAKHAMSDERRARLAELAKNMSAEQRRIISESNKRRVVSEETKRRMSEAQRIRHANRKIKQ